MNSRKIREIPIKIHQNQNENDQFQKKIPKFCEKMKNHKKSKNFEYGAVRRNVNLVDLEKSFKNAAK